MNQYEKDLNTISENKDQYFIDGILTNNPKVLNEIYQKYSKPILTLLLVITEQWRMPEIHFKKE